MQIRVEQLSHVYNPGTPLAHPALQGVDLGIAAGERVGILGATGSGKSTLVQLLAGLLVPTGGRVLLDGTPAHARNAAGRRQRRQVGLSFQYPEDQIFEPTVAREVAFGPRNLGLREPELTGRVRWALDMVGLDPAAFEERVPHALSGGEMRRVALASVLAMRPALLILDEPAAGLDPAGRRELLARVRAWQEQTGATLVAVSHDLDELPRLVDRVVLLQSGRVAADGPVRRVLSDGALLRSAGLEPPVTVALLQTLAEAGWPVRLDRLLPGEVVDEIVRARGERR